LGPGNSIKTEADIINILIDILTLGELRLGIES